MIGSRHLVVAARGALVAVWSLPLLLLVLASLVPEESLLAGDAWTPRSLTLAHYRELFATRRFWLPIRNSLVVASATTVLSVVLAVGCAYALVRLRFRGRTLVLGLVLAASMFPQIAILSPLFLLLRALGLIDTYPGLVLPYLTFSMPLAVWLLVTYLARLPWEVEEQALVDGASRRRVLARIVVPMALPGVATTAILAFLYCWNEFLFALTFTLGPERQTVPVAVALFRGHYQVPWGEILAASVVASLPVALLVLLFQRRIVAGLTAGAVKG